MGQSQGFGIYFTVSFELSLVWVMQPAIVVADPCWMKLEFSNSSSWYWHTEMLRSQSPSSTYVICLITCVALPQNTPPSATWQKGSKCERIVSLPSRRLRSRRRLVWTRLMHLPRDPQGKVTMRPNKQWVSPAKTAAPSRGVTTPRTHNRMG